MKKSKGFIQETAVFGVLMMLTAVFITVLAADAPGQMSTIFELLKNTSYVGAGLVPVIGIYLAWKLIF